MNGIPLSFGRDGLVWLNNAVMALPLHFFVAGHWLDYSLVN
ncbi:hypothetical protein [Streptococcus cuniculi]|nr:hypothetical protein [Streptococcus cuniculi]